MFEDQEQKFMGSVEHSVSFSQRSFLNLALVIF